MDGPAAPGDPASPGLGEESSSLAARMIARVTLSARRAALLISVMTLCIGIGGGVVMWAVDREDFPTLGSGMWFAIQTITTVGYGDHTPSSTEGRAVATLVMVTGIGFMSVITATITAIFVESARRKRRAPEEITLDHIAAAPGPDRAANARAP